MIFVSDTHLLSKKCCHKELLQFVSELDTEHLYLLGDIEDFWRLQFGRAKISSDFKDHVKIHHKIMKYIKNGMNITWILGNHDELIWKIFGGHDFEFEGFALHSEHVIELSNGKRCLLIHGQQFEFVTKYLPGLAFLGDFGYHGLIWLNKIFNKFRQKLGYPYWSLSKYIKVAIKNKTNLIGRFEELAAQYAKEKRCDIIICGHVHDPQIKQINDVWYVNLGCWTDLANCTYAKENDGIIELYHYPDNKCLGKTHS